MASLPPSVHQKSSLEPDVVIDDVLADLYATRDAYAAEHGHNLDRIYADLKRREANSLLRRVTPADLSPRL